MNDAPVTPAEHDKSDAMAQDHPTRLQRLLCGECFEPSTATVAVSCDGAPLAPAVEESVEVLLKLATDAVEDERERGRSLDAKTASLAGFTGVALSLEGALSRVLFDEDLGRVGKVTAPVFEIVAILGLLAALLLALCGVLMPQGYRGLGRSQLHGFASLSVQSMSVLEVRQSMLGTLAATLDHDRPVNNCKAKLTKVVARLLAVGYAATAAEVVTLAVVQLHL